jgi:hypothetical protein
MDSLISKIFDTIKIELLHSLNIFLYNIHLLSGIRIIKFQFYIESS